MIPERWERIEKVFHQVLDQPVREQEAFLDRATAGDPELRREVGKLLRADREAGSYMEWKPSSTHGPPSESLEAAADPTSPLEKPETIGPYRLLHVLGEGGMGTVYLAEQREPIHRRVAIKLIRPNLITRETTLRFRAEGQFLARLQHPNIAQIFEAGTAENGQPYLAMEHIPGLPITEYCDRHQLDIRRRLELFMQVCGGVEHLHQKAIIHRDLKPSNVLVMADQGKALVKILDFGVAKALDEPLPESPSLTGARILGTPSYLSPEAIQGPKEGAGVDTRSDIYALGVLLYELLTGDLPFGERGEAVPEILRRIVGGEARPPSSQPMTGNPERNFENARQRGLDPGALRHRLRGDLDWITMLAIAREPSRRYASATLLSDDVHRHLHHRPTLAGPPSMPYRIGKFARRHRTPLAAIVLAILALCGGLVARTLEAMRANREADRARAEADAAREVSQFLVDLFEISDPGNARGRTITAQELLENGARRIEDELASQPLLQARLMSVIGTVTHKLGLYELTEPLLQKALSIRQRNLPADSRDTASSLIQLANLHTELGRYSDAQPLYQHSLQILEGTHPAGHLALAAPLDNLAQLHAIQGAPKLAESLFLRSLRIREAHLDSSDPAMARILNNLGLLYLQEGRMTEAEPLLEKSLAAWEGRLGTDHPEVAMVLNNLAILRMRQGEAPRAEADLRRALAIRQKALGPEHALVAASLSNLADLLVRQGDYAAAEPLYQRCLQIAERSVGLDHSHAAYGFSGLAKLYWKLGRYDEAEPLLSRALEIRKVAFGADHPAVLQTEREYADLVREMGRDP